MLENRQKLLQKLPTFGMDVVGMLRQLVFPKAKQLAVESAAFGKLFQLHVALQQGAVVFQQSVEIQRVELRNHAVDELAAEVAALVDEVAVVRRNHHQGELPDMVAEAVVFLLVEAKRLLLVTFLHTRHQLIIFAFMRIHAVDGKEILLVADVLFVGRAEKTLAKRKVINRVEDVGFSCPIEAHETIDILRKQQVSRLAILEVGQFEFVEMHDLELTQVHADCQEVGRPNNIIARIGIIYLESLDFHGETSREANQSAFLGNIHFKECLVVVGNPQHKILPNFQLSAQHQMATKVVEELLSFARRNILSRDGVVILLRKVQIVRHSLPILNVVIAKYKGQRQMVEFLGRNEIQRKRQPLVFHIQLLANDLSRVKAQLLYDQ